ncbi:MAG: YiiX/YebB-like N1pC/P60 family cysteine hydrolase [Bacteroidia bacterium]|jgi:hypothetical protein
MRRLKRLVLLFTALFLVALGYFVYQLFLNPENTKQIYYPLSEAEKGLLRSGDILLRKGYGYFSEKIAGADTPPFQVSHCAMLINRNNTWQVVHALSSSVSSIDGVQYQPLQQFLNESQANSLLVCRLKTSADTLQRIIGETLRYAEEQRAFDHAFDSEDTTSVYCTELFNLSFTKILGRDIFQTSTDSEGKSLFNFAAFKDTSAFECILNHQLVLKNK